MALTRRLLLSVLPAARLASGAEKYPNIPSEIRDQVPVIYLGSHRLLKDQIPGARNFLLRQLFEDVNEDFSNPARTIEVTAADGTKTQVPRKDRFGQLMSEALGC